MSGQAVKCPRCGAEVFRYRNPTPTVDIVISCRRDDGSSAIVLIQRKNEPLGWALPGGFIDYGESAETAARREAKEETGLEVELLGLIGVYSDPARDPRGHTITTAFAASASGSPRAGDDAAGVGLFGLDELPSPLCFDHGQIVADYARWRRNKSPSPG